MSLKTERINAQILREVSLILQNEVRSWFTLMYNYSGWNNKWFIYFQNLCYFFRKKL